MKCFRLKHIHVLKWPKQISDPNSHWDSWHDHRARRSSRSADPYMVASVLDAAVLGSSSSPGDLCCMSFPSLSTMLPVCLLLENYQRIQSISAARKYIYKKNMFTDAICAI
ncbi:hypothetical protein ILYODFUR_011006 [Ilyodon furcidens]|uniref:Uncharacterized protein n=1 Tax=Ilyodon furcidens TaxID=33524 RepID=A0ABV0U4U1_9TELE